MNETVRHVLEFKLGEIEMQRQTAEYEERQAYDRWREKQKVRDELTQQWADIKNELDPIRMEVE